MHRTYNIRFGILLLLTIPFHSCNEQGRANSKLVGKTLPLFHYQLLDSVSIIESVDFLKDKPLLIFIFDPDCMFCKGQLQTILQQEERFNGANIYMISYAPLERIKEYYLEMNLDHFNNIVVGRDRTGQTIKEYQIKSVPFTGVYDRNHNLKKSFSGVVSTDLLLRTLFN